MIEIFLYCPEMLAFRQVLHVKSAEYGKLVK